jgi:hypothetical protein
VVLALWLPLPWRPGRGKAMPLLVRFYRTRARCPQSRYRKRTELALEMVQRLAEWLPSGRTLHVVGDAEYASRTVVRPLPAGVEFVGPMPPNAALYAPVKGYGGRGRPRKRGRRLSSPVRRAQRKEGWTTLGVRLYGREVRVQVKSFVCLWYTVAGSRPVRVVITRDPKGRIRDRTYFCTDPEIGVAALLERYAQRWELEVSFREVKQSLGLEDPRNGWWRRRSSTRRPRMRPGPQPRGNRGQTAVLHTAPLAFFAYAITVVWYVKCGAARQDVAAARRHAPWYRHKTHPSFEDMLASLQREIWATRFSATPGKKRPRKKSSPVLYPWANAA